MCRYRSLAFSSSANERNWSKSVFEQCAEEPIRELYKVQTLRPRPQWTVGLGICISDRQLRCFLDVSPQERRPWLSQGPFILMVLFITFYFILNSFKILNM